MIEHILVNVGEKKFIVAVNVFDVSLKDVLDAIKKAQDTEELVDLLDEISLEAIFFNEISIEVEL